MTPFSTPTAERITSAEIAAAPRGPASAKAASAATRVEEITFARGSRYRYAAFKARKQAVTISTRATAPADGPAPASRVSPAM